MEGDEGIMMSLSLEQIVMQSLAYHMQERTKDHGGSGGSFVFLGKGERNTTRHGCRI